jgi:hypothetical protein
MQASVCAWSTRSAVHRTNVHAGDRRESVTSSKRQANGPSPLKVADVPSERRRWRARLPVRVLLIACLFLIDREGLLVH